MSDPQPLPVLALVRDLMFSSKITAAARANGAAVKIIRDPAKLGNEPGRLLLLDLNLPRAIESASAWREQTGRQVAGFVSHVDAETAARARAAGIDRVMARSHFVQILDELLKP